MLGIKHLLVQATGSAQHLLPLAVDTLLQALHEHDDEVRAAAAQACAAVSHAIMLQSPGAIRQMAAALWAMLPELDDLSAATSSVLQLLQALYSAEGSSAGGDIGNKPSSTAPAVLLTSTEEVTALQVR